VDFIAAHDSVYPDSQNLDALLAGLERLAEQAKDKLAIAQTLCATVRRRKIQGQL